MIKSTASNLKNSFTFHLTFSFSHIYYLTIIILPVSFREHSHLLLTYSIISHLLTYTVHTDLHICTSNLILSIHLQYSMYSHSDMFNLTVYDM